MSRRNLLFIIIGVIAVLFIVLIILGTRKPATQKLAYQPANLTIWGAYDDPSYYDQIITDFQRTYPGITVTYRTFSSSTYQSSLINGLASGSGPDIFMINNTWMGSYQDKIATAPASLISPAVYSSTFDNVATKDFVLSNAIYAVPLYVDTMALYYNTDLFNSAGIAQPPATWSQFNQDVQTLTKLDQYGNITQAGGAIGTSQNINRSTDILSLLMMQSGAKMYDRINKDATFDQAVGSSTPGQQALTYYTNFANSANQDYTWNSRMPYSVDAFEQGKVAMMFNYSFMISQLKTQAPYLHFAVAPMPQLDTSNKKNIANYWALTVAKTSPHPYDAWMFLTFLGSNKEMEKYLQAAQVPTPIPALYNWQLSDKSTDPLLDPFIQQTLTADDWYEPDANAVEQIFANMIDQVNLGQKTVSDALSNAATLVTNLGK